MYYSKGVGVWGGGEEREARCGVCVCGGGGSDHRAAAMDNMAISAVYVFLGLITSRKSHTVYLGPVSYTHLTLPTKVNV